MSVEVRVPQMGESIVEATVGRWLKKEGDAVSAGESVVELETEKVNTEVPAQQSGVLERVLKREGETVRISDVLALIAEGQAERAAPERPAEAHETEEPPSQAAPPPRKESERMEGDGRREAAPAATPVARNIAAEHGIQLTAVRGTGPGGKITKEDVSAHLGRTREEAARPRAEQEAPPRSAPPPEEEREEEERPAPPQPVFAEPLAAGEPAGYEERVRLSRRRLTIARRLVEAQRETATATTFNEIDVSAVMDLRKRRRQAFRERHGVDLGLMPFFVRAVVAALRAFPVLNSELQGDELVLKHYYHIGIAVASEEGLVVPVLRDADRLTFAEIESAVQGMVQRTRDRRLTMEELQGGTFTITNGGIFGSLLSTPLLNPPQVGILGMHRIEERPRALEGQVVVRPMMYVALTYDHRVVDGEQAVRFLRSIKEFVEEPVSLLLEQ